MLAEERRVRGSAVSPAPRRGGEEPGERRGWKRWDAGTTYGAPLLAVFSLPLSVLALYLCGTESWVVGEALFAAAWLCLLGAEILGWRVGR